MGRPVASSRPRNPKYSRVVPTIGCPRARKRTCSGIGSARPDAATRSTSEKVVEAGGSEAK